MSFIASLETAGVELAGLNFWAGNMAAGDRGMVSVIGAEEDFAANVDIVVEIGRRTGCRAFNALYGLRTEGQDAAGQDATAVANLSLAANAVAAIGGTVLVEPVSGAEAYPLKRFADAAEVVAAVRADVLIEHRRARRLLPHERQWLSMWPWSSKPRPPTSATSRSPTLRGAEHRAPDRCRCADSINRAYALGYTGSVALEYKQDRATAFDWLAHAAQSA